MKDLKLVKVFAFRYEAQLLKGLLSENGIESMIVSDDAGGFRPELNFASSGVRLFVRKEDREKAGKIIKKAEE
ncbi:MAG: putative signal transducing protein [Elusimicrobiota bacterium]